MYFPYLRGRQNELICLRELLKEGLLSPKIVPIIEPVRYSSTLFSTLESFIKNERPIILIENPKVGSFKEEEEAFFKKLKDSNQLEITAEKNENILQNKYIQKAYLTDKTILDKCINGEINVDDVVLINEASDYYNIYNDNKGLLNAKLTVVPFRDELADVITGNLVCFRDGFKKAKRNVDYADSPDEFFNRTHILYKNYYKGFSDFSIVGKNYEESGFAPVAIAIHIVYFDKDDLNVHHFLSKTNDDISDPARKFAEAVEDMLQWGNYKMIKETYGLKKIIEYYNDGRFPGLGVVKKYSIMHHLELIGDFLEDEK